MCLFVGPAQSASRSFLARLVPPESDGQMFGLYATTGRAVSFLAPALFGLFTAIFATDRAGIAGIALAYDYLKRMKIERSEYYVLLLFSVSGMLLMAQAYDMIIVFLALELLSIPLYVLAGFARQRQLDRRAVTGFTHSLIQLFDRHDPLLNAARGLGLTLLDNIAPLRRAFAGHLVFGVGG